MDKDFATKVCLSDDERFADLINGLLFDGKQKVQASDFQETDSQSYYKMKSYKKDSINRVLYRDIIKRAKFGVNFVLLGIENQSHQNYLMPLRTMEYDVAEYSKQAMRRQKNVKRMKRISDSEFLSGFCKTDRLHPCITVVLYYGEKWEGAKSLYDILDFTDIPIELRAYINDYPIHIFSISEIPNTDVFCTDLRQIFEFIKQSKNKEKLNELVNKDEAYQNLAEEAYDMIAVCTRAEKLISMKKHYGKDGKFDMCQALDEWLADERKIGIEQGIEQSYTMIIYKKIKKNMTLEEIADVLEEDVERIRPIYEKVTKKDFVLPIMKSGEHKKRKRLRRSLF